MIPEKPKDTSHIFDTAEPLLMLKNMSDTGNEFIVDEVQDFVVRD